jgi:hypothetical protein
MGHIYTRAPENWKKGNHPAPSSDVFGYGALCYRLLSKEQKYPFEDEINNSKDPSALFSSLSYEVGNKIIKEKIRKNIPKDWQKLLIRCMRFDSFSRYKDGKELQKVTEEVLKYRGRLGAIKKNIVSIAKWGLSATALSAMIYGVSVHEPKEMSVPEIFTKGETYIGNPVTKDQIKFEQENVPYTTPQLYLFASGNDYNNIKMYTNNANVVFVTTKYMRAALESRRLISNDEQSAIYSTHRMASGIHYMTINTSIDIPLKCIEYAMNVAKNPSGAIDLEDMCTIATVGSRKWNAARKVSGSFDYATYSNAKDVHGNNIIPKEDIEFINIWRGHLNSH